MFTNPPNQVGHSTRLPLRQFLPRTSRMALVPNAVRGTALHPAPISIPVLSEPIPAPVATNSNGHPTLHRRVSAGNHKTRPTITGHAIVTLSDLFLHVRHIIPRQRFQNLERLRSLNLSLNSTLNLNTVGTIVQNPLQGVPGLHTIRLKQVRLLHP